ncbi:hypothetical protein [Neptuniibacter sp. QD37_11]|uniref:hypothetical protein n=1 Tax=Neptuniibacter sp. QD37_11 TaxID=3398209 RepID=UPI0039F631E9
MISLQPHEYDIQIKQLPELKMPDTEVASYLTLEHAKHKDLDPLSIVTDFAYLPEDAYYGRGRWVYAVYADRNTMDSVVRFAESTLRSRLVSIDIPEFSLHKLTQLDESYSTSAEQGEIIAYVLLGSPFSICNIVKKGQLYFSKQIPFDALRSDRVAALNDCALQIQRTLDYFTKQLGVGECATVKFLPTTSAMQAFTETLAVNLSSPITATKILMKDKKGQDASNLLLPETAISIGASLMRPTVFTGERAK